MINYQFSGLIFDLLLNDVLSVEGGVMCTEFITNATIVLNNTSGTDGGGG